MRQAPRESMRPLIRVTRLLLYLGSFALVVIGIGSERGLLDLRRMLRQNQGLNEKLAALELQKAGLQDQIHRFESDKEEREKVVRQVLGYIRSNETVIEFE